MSDDTVPVEQLYRFRQEAQDQRDWDAALTVGAGESGPGTPGPVTVGTAEENLAKGAAAAQDLAPRPVATPLTSASEQARGRFEALQQEGPVRKGVDAALRTFTGSSLEDIERSIRTGTLSERLSMKLTDPVGSLMETLARSEAEKQGVDPETAAKIGSGSGLLMGMLFGPPSGKTAGKAAKLGTKLAERAGINVERVAAEPGVKQTMKAVSAMVSERLAGARQTVTHEQTIAEGKALMRPAKDLAGLQREQQEALAAWKEAERRWTISKEEAKSEGHFELAGQVRFSEEVEAAHNRLTRANTALADAQRAPTQGLTLEQAASLDVDKFDFRPVQQAVRDYHNAASQYLYNVAKATAAGDEQAAGRLYEALAVAGELSVRDELLGKVAARGLEGRKILSEAGRAPFDTADVARMAETLQGLGGAVDPQVLAQRILSMSAKERKTFTGQAIGGLRMGQDVLYEAWINALLTGPQTHAANVASNSITAAWAPYERTLSAMLDIGKDRSVFMGEGAAMLYGMVEGLADGIKLVGRSIREGKAPVAFGPEKVERPIAIAASRFGLDSGSVPGAAIDYLGTAVRAPGTALQFEDAFFKAVNYRMELRALAYREASRLELAGAERAEFIRRTLVDPPAEVKARAEAFALAQTFNRELSDIGMVGGMASGLMQAAEAVPMGRVVLPFVRTPANIMHWSMERTPILNGISDTLRADIAAGGERRALAYGKVAGGMSLAAVVTSLAAAGRISGGGPQEAATKGMQRETGWQPYSIKIGETWYSYNRLDPIGATLGIMADYADLAGQIPEGARIELALAMGLAVSKHMTSKTYLQGVADVIEAAQAPEQGADKYVRSLARTLVPTGVRQVTRTLDPTVRETKALTEVDGILNEVKAGVPGWSATLPPRRNLFGEPVLLSGGWGPDLISPIYSSTVKDDPVAAELVKQKVALTLPSPVMAGTPPKDLRFTPERATEGIRLTPQEYDRLLVLTGQGTGSEPPLRQALAEMMAAPDYQQQTNGPDGGKALLIRRLVMVYKQAAAAQLRQESPELAQAIERQQQRRIEALDPAAQQPPTPQGAGMLQQLLKGVNPQ